MSDEPKKRGRKPAGKNATFKFRLTDQLREKLVSAAAKRGRPVSEEIELRLEQSFLLQDVRETIRQEFADARLQSAGRTNIEPKDWIKACGTGLGSNLTNFERKDGYTYLGPVIGKQPDCQ